ncbi:hypothetical protein R5W24_000487 [Gemmata sp. JC717]|uniref:hypothetical protein n=1 Tax=Gemmata algarum TaxID=2975278 RepID=UPI0021BAA20A|nr:hypothetical protein [Gemmata algarum]MDY3551411.1 hypothetical protein [Gemmata algarum]
MSKKPTKIEDPAAEIVPAPAGQEQPESSADAAEGLVKMSKDGESLHVHPATVSAHMTAGWALA